MTTTGEHKANIEAMLDFGPQNPLIPVGSLDAALDAWHEEQFERWRADITIASLNGKVRIAE